MSITHTVFTLPSELHVATVHDLRAMNARSKRAGLPLSLDIPLTGRALKRRLKTQQEAPTTLDQMPVVIQFIQATDTARCECCGEAVPPFVRVRIFVRGEVDIFDMVPEDFEALVPLLLPHNEATCSSAV